MVKLPGKPTRSVAICSNLLGVVKPIPTLPKKFDTPVTDNDPPIPTLPEVLRPDKEVNPKTDKDEDSDVPDVTVKDEPIPTLPEILADEPIPTKPVKNPVPWVKKL